MTTIRRRPIERPEDSDIPTNDLMDAVGDRSAPEPASLPTRPRRGRHLTPVETARMLNPSPFEPEAQPSSRPGGMGSRAGTPDDAAAKRNPETTESDFLRHIGFAYGTFLQSMSNELLNEGDRGGMGSFMLALLRRDGVGPMGLSGFDLRLELTLGDGVFWERSQGGRALRIFTPDERKQHLGLQSTASQAEVFDAACARVTAPTPASGFLSRFRSKARDNRVRFYCFSAFWLRDGLTSGVLRVPVGALVA